MESNLQDNLSALPAEPGPTDSTVEAKLPGKPKKEFSSLKTRAEDVLAQEFAEIYGDHFRYDNMRQRWLVWDEHFWRPDENGEVHPWTLGRNDPPRFDPPKAVIVSS